MKGSIKNFILTGLDEILVKSNHKEKFQSDSGIIFSVQPSVIDDRPTSGEVIQIGTNIKDINIGDIAHFNKVSGEDLFFDEDKDIWYIILNIKSIYGIQKV